MFSKPYIVKFENPLDRTRNKYVFMDIYGKDNAHYVRASSNNLGGLVDIVSKGCKHFGDGGFPGCFFGFSFEKPSVDFISFSRPIEEGGEPSGKRVPAFYFVKRLTPKQRRKFAFEFYNSFKKYWGEENGK